MVMEGHDKYAFRKANSNDNLLEIAELLYNTDPYIYPYWFGSLDNCLNVLPSLLLDEKFFFNINNLYVLIEKSSNKIVGVICIVDKNVDLDYDYSKLLQVNDRYKFTIENYIFSLIKEVKNSNFAYISNVCIDKDYRGKHLGNMMLNWLVDIYKRSIFKELALDVIKDNGAAVKLYENIGFEQSSEVFKGFNDPNEESPDVFSMSFKFDVVDE